MIKTTLLVLTFFVFATPVQAESIASVKINNNINSSSDSTVNSQTDISIETNGQQTTYSSDKAQDIEVKSVNGVSEIKVDGNIVSGNNSNNPTTGPTASPTARPSQKPDGNGDGDQNKNIFEVFGDLFKKIFFLLS